MQSSRALRATPNVRGQGAAAIRPRHSDTGAALIRGTAFDPEMGVLSILRTSVRPQRPAVCAAEKAAPACSRPLPPPRVHRSTPPTRRIPPFGRTRCIRCRRARPDRRKTDKAQASLLESPYWTRAHALFFVAGAGPCLRTCQAYSDLIAAATSPSRCGARSGCIRSFRTLPGPFTDSRRRCE